MKLLTKWQLRNQSIQDQLTQDQTRTEDKRKETYVKGNEEAEITKSISEVLHREETPHEASTKIRHSQPRILWPALAQENEHMNIPQKKAYLALTKMNMEMKQCKNYNTSQEKNNRNIRRTNKENPEMEHTATKKRKTNKHIHTITGKIPIVVESDKNTSSQNRRRKGVCKKTGPRNSAN